MPTYQVEVLRTIATTVEVEARNPEDAVSQADNFDLPPVDEWSGLNDWQYVVYGEGGEELLRRD